MTKTDRLLYGFLVEENGMPADEFGNLSESTKSDTIIASASKVLDSISKKLGSIDLTDINRTRGEIRNYADLSVIQNSLTKLSNMLASGESANPELASAVKEIIKTMFNLNRYASVFKEAYRSKKTVLILKYQSLVLSVISSISYLVSIAVDFKDSTHLRLKDHIEIEEILPLKSLFDFNRSIETGTFDAAVSDVAMLREFYVEYGVEQLSTIYEAIDIVNLLNQGIQSFSSFIGNRNTSSLMFKALGVIMIILSLRSAFYSVYNSRNDIKSKISQLKAFLDPAKQLQSVSSMSRFITYNNKNVADSESASKRAESEMKAENRAIIQDVKSKPSDFEQSVEFMPTQVVEPKAQPIAADVNPADGADDDFGFNF